MGWGVGSSMWEDIMRVEISAINKATINGFGVSSAIILEWRFTEVSGKRTVRYPSGGLFKLSIK